MKPHEILSKYIEGLARGYTNSLVMSSPAGYGKSETTINALKQAGLEKDKHYIYLANYLTPKALVEILEATNKLLDPRILVIDEAEHILNNLEIVGVLKSCLWEVDGQRKVYWITSREHIEFQFNGKIIFILNKINKKSAIVNALIDRSLFYEMKLTLPDMFELMRQRAELPYQDIPISKRQEIVGFLEKVSSEKSNISLRTLQKAFNLYLLSPNSYQNLVRELL